MGEKLQIEPGKISGWKKLALAVGVVIVLGYGFNFIVDIYSHYVLKPQIERQLQEIIDGNGK